MKQLRRRLAEANKNYILLAGDSHAAYLLHPHFPRPVVNIGIPGATTRSYARSVSSLRPMLPARLAVLMIGTNDISQPVPLRDAALDAFTDRAGRVIGWLKSSALDVSVAALPPACDAGPWPRDPQAVQAYSDALSGVCARTGVEFFDPFDYLRGSRFGIAAADVYIDGTHLHDYHPLARSIGTHVRAKLKTEGYCADVLPGFDPDYYRAWYPDVQDYPSGLAGHYCDLGWKEGRDPCGHFSTDGYLRTNPDVRDSGINPLLHFLEVGLAQGRTGWQKTNTDPSRHRG